MVRGDSQLFTPRSKMKKLFKSAAHRWMFKQFDAFLVVGKRNAEYLEHYGVRRERMFCARHFVDNGWFRSRANAARGESHELRTRWRATQNTTVALFVGKLIPEKRPKDILEALQGLGHGPDITAVFVGSGCLESELKAKVRDKGLRVYFEGFRNQSELPQFYTAADVLVLPSASETWGLVVNEAMACGTPAIVSHSAGCAPDMIDEGRTGFTFPAGNTGALGERLCRISMLLKENFDFRPHLGEKLKTYSVDSATEGTLRAIRALGERVSPPHGSPPDRLTSMSRR
jgi:glycosyltransferase involved in cell wall biosynthesis